MHKPRAWPGDDCDAAQGRTQPRQSRTGHPRHEPVSRSPRHMKPAKFEYHAPSTLDEAIALLVRYGGDAKLLAGRPSPAPLLNFPLAPPAAPVELYRATSPGSHPETPRPVRVR